MEKKKSIATDITSSLKNLQLNSAKKLSASSPSSHLFDPPLRRNKPRSLVSLCLGVIGQYLEDIVEDLADTVSDFPPDAKDMNRAYKRLLQRKLEE